MRPGAVEGRGRLESIVRLRSVFPRVSQESVWRRCKSCIHEQDVSAPLFRNGAQLGASPSTTRWSDCLLHDRPSGARGRQEQEEDRAHHKVRGPNSPADLGAQTYPPLSNVASGEKASSKDFEGSGRDWGLTMGTLGQDAMERLMPDGSAGSSRLAQKWCTCQRQQRQKCDQQQGEGLDDVFAEVSNGIAGQGSERGWRLAELTVFCLLL